MRNAIGKGVHITIRIARRLWDYVTNSYTRYLVAEAGPGSYFQRRVWFGSPEKAQIGENVFIGAGTQFGSEEGVGHLIIENDVRINRNCSIDHTGGLFIGECALISAEVIIYTHDHRLDPRSVPIKLPKRIGRRVWIGSRALILAGCTDIGDDAIIGAGSVVAKDVQSGTIVAGSPAKIIGYKAKPV